MKDLNLKTKRRSFVHIKRVKLKLKNAVLRLKGPLYLATTLLTFPVSAHADGTTAVGILTNFSTYLTSDIARAVAIIAIIGVGFGWMTGRISKMHAIAVVAGIAIVFSASAIVGHLQNGA